MCLLVSQGHSSPLNAASVGDAQPLDAVEAPGTSVNSVLQTAKNRDFINDNHDKLILYRRISVSPHTAIGVEVDMLDMVTMIAPAFS